MPMGVRAERRGRRVGGVTCQGGRPGGAGAVPWWGPGWPGTPPGSSPQTGSIPADAATVPPPLFCCAPPPSSCCRGRPAGLYHTPPCALPAGRDGHLEVWGNRHRCEIATVGKSPLLGNRHRWEIAIAGNRHCWAETLPPPKKNGRQIHSLYQCRKRGAFPQSFSVFSRRGTANGETRRKAAQDED